VNCICFRFLEEKLVLCTFTNGNHAFFQITFFLTSYVIPLAITVCLYIGMVFRLWKSGFGALTENNRILQGKRRVTWMVVTVVSVFALCWLPIQVISVLKSLHKYEITGLSVGIQIAAHVLGYLNSCVNPIIYLVMSGQFRRAFCQSFCCKTKISSSLTREQKESLRLSNIEGRTSIDCL